MNRKREAGQTLALVAFGMLTFLAAAGLAIDMGYMRYEKRAMQAAADSAALAAATDANLGAAGAQAATDALAVTQANGFQDGSNGVVVTVNNPDASVNPPNAVQVVIQRTIPSFFMQAWGVGTTTLTVAGVATIGTSEGCVYALQVGGPGLILNGGLNAQNCGIVDNGPLSGAGTLTAASIGVYGANAYGATLSGAPVEITAQPAANPLAYLTPPTPAAGCPVVTDPAVPLDPGTYCAITITTVAAVFNPGLYIIEGAGLQITGTGTATVAGSSGVTFYITNGAAVSFTSTSGSIRLSAPDAAEVASNGTFQGLPPGILFFQNPDTIYPAIAADLSDDGLGGSVILNGTLYFPNGSLTVAGSLDPNSNTPMVAQSITVNAGVTLNADSTSVPGRSPMQNVSLVE